MKKALERDSCLALTPAGWVLAHGTALGTVLHPLPSQLCLAGTLSLFSGSLVEKPQPPGPHFLDTGPGFSVLGTADGASERGLRSVITALALPFVTRVPMTLFCPSWAHNGP